jgi:hypothetical protein
MAQIDCKFETALKTLILDGLHYGETEIQIVTAIKIAGRGRGSAQFRATIPEIRTRREYGTIAYDIEADGSLTKTRQINGLDFSEAYRDHETNLRAIAAQRPKKHGPAAQKRAVALGILLDKRSA